LFLLAGLLVAGSACAHHPGVASDVEAKPSVVADVRVYVVNHYGLSMEIYVAGSGITHRLGLVAAATTRSFVLPQAMIGNGTVEFRAQPTGFGPIVRSEQLVLRPGHVVDFEIATNLIGSRATIRM
jgi:hypothetical protein